MEDSARSDFSNKPNSNAVAMKKLTAFLFFTLVCAVPALRAQDAIRALSGPKGIWIDLTGAVADGPGPYAISGRSAAGGAAFAPRVTQSLTTSYEDFIARWSEIQSIQPGDEVLSDALLTGVWNRWDRWRRLDSLGAYATSLHMLYALGAAWMDEGVAAGSYEYRVETPAGRGGRTKTYAAATRYPQPRTAVATLAPILIQPTKQGVYLEFEVLSLGTMRTARVMRGYYERSLPEPIAAEVSFISRGGKTILTVTDRTAVPRVPYTYTALPVDEAGNMGIASAAARVLNVPTASLPPSVLHLTAKSDTARRAIRLSWRPPGTPDVVSIQLYRADSFSGVYTPIASLSPVDTVYYDRNVEPVQPYFYTAAVNGTFERSVNTPRVPGLLAAADRNAHPPVDLTATAGAGNVVTLRWRRTGPPVDGYHVYRATGHRGELKRITAPVQDGGTEIIYRDTLPALTETTVFSYAVASQNSSYAESLPSARASVQAAPATALSAIPVARAMPAANGSVQIFWTDLFAAGADISGYTVRRTARDRAGKVIETDKPVTQAPLLPNRNMWVDASVQRGWQYTYTVTALRGSGAEGSPSMPVGYTVPLDPPQPPTAVEAFAADGAVGLSWNLPMGTALKSVVVLRALTGKTPEVIATLPADATAYDDKAVKADKAYHYYLATQNTDGIYSAYTSPVTVRVR